MKTQKETRDLTKELRKEIKWKTEKRNGNIDGEKRKRKYCRKGENGEMRKGEKREMKEEKRQKQ